MDKKLLEQYHGITHAMRHLHGARSNILMTITPAKVGDKIKYWCTVGSKSFSRIRREQVGVIQSIHYHHLPVHEHPTEENGDKPFWSFRVQRITPENKPSRFSDSVMETDFIEVISPGEDDEKSLDF
jgi:hypothetical protein